MRRAPWISGVLATLGCTEVVHLDVPLPPLGTAKSALITAADDSRVQAWLLDLERTPPLERAPSIDGDATIELSIAAFDVDLSRLGLRAGPLVLGELTTGAALPEPAVAFEARVEDLSVGAWTERDTLPASLTGVRVPGGRGPCQDFRLEARAVPVRDTPGVLVALDASTFLLGTHGGHFFTVTRERITPQPALSGLPGYAAHRAADGELWLFGESGTAARGTLERGFVRTASAPTTRDLVELAPVPGSTRAVDLFVVSDEGSLFRFDGSRWITLHAAVDRVPTYSRALAAIADDHVVLTTNSEKVRRWRRGEVTEERPYPFDIREVSSVALVEGVGVVAGTAIEGRLLVYTADGEWSFLEAQGIGPDALGVGVDDLVPYRDGLWMSGSLGAHGQWYPSWGFCERGPSIAPLSTRRTVVLDDGGLLVVTDFDGPSSNLVWLAPLP